MSKTKTSLIAERFSQLRENYSPVNAIAYADFLRSQSPESILENVEYVFVEPTRGPQVLLETLQSHDLPFQLLVESLQKLNKYYFEKANEGYGNIDHMNELRECMAAWDQIIMKKDSIQYLRESAIEHLQNKYEKIRERVAVIEGTLPEDVQQYAHLQRLETAFGIGFVETFLDESEEVNMESFNKMVTAWYQYEKVMEGPDGVHGVMRKAALKAEDASRNLAHGIRKMGANSKRVGVVVQRVPQHVDNLIDNTLGKLKEMDQAERRNRIIEGGYKVKLFKIIRNAITLGGAYLIHPALAAIGLITAIAIDQKLDKNVRNRLVDELEDELKLVVEKIEDAKGDRDKQKKYQLMRIKNKLENDIKRIQYRLDD